MKVTSTILALATATTAVNGAAFVPSASSSASSVPQSKTILRGYLDNLSNDLYKPDDCPDEVADSREANKMSKDQIASYGPASMEGFVDFEEFDGGDGQMGVAGDGQKGLDKSEFQTGALASQLKNSRSMSAKNAWGTSTGYADELMRSKPGMDASRAQQLENWHQQREIQAQKVAQRQMTDAFDQVQQNAEADWRTLAKFGVERNQDFDMNQAFGAATIEGGDVEGTITLKAGAGALGYHEFDLKNPYMGFADFRATFSPETSNEWTVSPNEGSLMQREATTFAVRYKPERLGVSEGYLIIETEDFKKVWKLVGSTG